MTDFIKHKVADAIALTVSDTGKTMAERITDEACTLLASKIDDVVTKITNGTLNKLREKIDSEEFSEKFVNVLQQKLIDGMPPDDPFLNKFIKLFDNIIEKAINNYGKPINIPPEDIAKGIADYLQKNVPEFWESGGQKYSEAAEKVMSDFKAQSDQSQSAFIEALRKSVVTPSILGQVTFNSALYDAIEKYKTKPGAPIVAEAVPEVTATPVAATPLPSIVPEVTPIAEPSPDATTPAPKMGGYRSKRTRKVSRISKSRRNRRNQPKVLTKRNLFL